MIRRALVALVAAVVVLAPTAAVAAEELGLSRDGTTFTPTLDQPLFDPDLRWVPGDVRTATFFVRNESDLGAELGITLRSEPLGSLIGDGWVSVRVSAPGLASTPGTGPGPTELLTKVPVDGGESFPVDVEVTFAPESPNGTQLSSSDLDLDLVLVQTEEDGGVGGDGDGPPDGDADGGADGDADGGSDGDADADGTAGADADGEAGAGSGSGTPGTSSSLLPATGARAVVWLLLPALILIAAGLAVDRRTRTRGETHD